jgi:hypothetical protein
MKQSNVILLIAGLFVKAALFAQDAPKSPSWVSNKGFWVVENNIHIPKQCVVYFYNNDGVLVYKEKVNGLRIDPSRKTTKLQLKQVLETSVLAWEQQHRSKENESLVVNQFRKRW